MPSIDLRTPGLSVKEGNAGQFFSGKISASLPVSPTFFLHSRHLFFFFFPESFTPESSAEAPGESVAVEVAVAAYALALSSPEASSSD